MPAGRNTKGQNGQDHEPNVPGGGWMHENFRVLRWPGRSFFLTSPFIGLRDLSNHAATPDALEPLLVSNIAANTRHEEEISMISHRWFRRLGGLVVSFILLLSAGSLVPGAEDADRKVVPDQQGIDGDMNAIDLGKDEVYETQDHVSVADEVPKGLSAEDWNPIRGIVEQKLYDVEKEDDPAGLFAANNQRHKMRTLFQPEGVRVVPAGAKDAAWEWGMTLRSYGYEGSMRVPQVARRVAEGNRIEYRRGEIVEWYINDSGGLEQGFTLTEQPEEGRQGDLLIELALEGSLQPQWTDAGHAVRFADADGKTILNYAGLVAWDAEGRTLPATMARLESGLVLRVDDCDAVYPITVDPMIVTEDAKLLASDGASPDLFGISVSVSGDTVVVGARGDTPPHRFRLRACV